MDQLLRAGYSYFSDIHLEHSSLCIQENFVLQYECVISLRETAHWSGKELYITAKF